MKIIKNVLLVLLTLLSASAGIAKIARVPSEVEFFAAVGLGAGMLILFGVAQLVGAVLLVPQKTRLLGAILVATMLLLSAVMIFMSGNAGFGFISLIPMLMAVYIALDSLRRGTATGQQRS